MMTVCFCKQTAETMLELGLLSVVLLKKPSRLPTNKTGPTEGCCHTMPANWEKAFTLYQFILGHAGKLYGSQGLLASALLSQVFLFFLDTVKKTIQFTVTQQVPVTRKSWEAVVAPLSDFPFFLLPMETTHRCTPVLKEEGLKTKTNRKRHAFLSTQLIF